MRPRRSAALLAAAGVLLAAGGVAARPGQVDPPGPRTVSGIDAAKDVKGRLDIRRVELSRLKGDRTLRGDIVTRRTWGTGDLRSSRRMDATLCLRLFTRGDPESEAPDRLVCAGPAPDGEKLVARVLRERNGGPPKVIAKARARRTSGRGLRLFFPRAAVGPKRLLGVRFGAETAVHARGCPAPAGCRDLGPDAPDTLYLDLR